MMKYILKITLILIVFSCKAQNPTYRLNDWPNKQSNAYYKDLNNDLNAFEGTWLYTEGNTSLKIVLKKQNKFFNGKYYLDLIVGEYQYIKNGVEKINTLSYINTRDGDEHAIFGESIYNNCRYLPVSDCVEGEERLSVNLVDVIASLSSDFILHKRIVNGQEAIRASFVISYSGRYDNETGEALVQPTLPWQKEYLFIKQ